LGFGSTRFGARAIGLLVYKLGSSGGRPCVAPGCILPSDVRISVRPSGRVVLCVPSCRECFGGSSVSAGARACSCRAGGGSTALFGGGPKSAPLSHSLVSCACAWLTGEHCRFAFFKVAYVGADAWATGSTSDRMARHMAPNARGSTRGPVSSRLSRFHQRPWSPLSS
jgi:hypothetical protein